MCGIAGILARTAGPLSDIVVMTRNQEHRGPDGRGFAVGNPESLIFSANYDNVTQSTGTIALGHTRLAIIDPDVRSAQPMFISGGMLWITYNGEIYNYRELRSELEALGHTFNTASDTEVILAAYRQWGRSCFSRFNGMWALAIVDHKKRELVLSRDRLGIKPLHYTYSNGRLLFASEIKALLPAMAEKPTLDIASAAAFLANSQTNQTNDTFFAGISAFPPGSHASVSFDTPGTLEPESFWVLRSDSSAAELEYSHSAIELRTLFNDAIRLQLRSDVPVGTCLSGGLDSSAIASVATTFLDSPLNTFTASNEVIEKDETAWAANVAKSIGAIDHYTAPSMSGFESVFEKLVWHQDEPVSSTSVYAQWCVMALAREHGVPVLLDGQGADELFCGYKKYFPVYLAEQFRTGQGLSAVGNTIQFLCNGDKGFLRWHEAERYLPRVLWRQASLIDQTLDGPLGPLARIATASLLTRSVPKLQLLDIQTTSLPSLLRYEDRNSMAWSVESRVPFLDHRLVEFAMALPVDFKLRSGTTKAILRSAMKDVVHPSIINRRDKFNFFAPLTSWLNNGLDARLVNEIKESSVVSSLLNTTAIIDIYEREPRMRSVQLDNLLFRIGMLAAWARVFNVSLP